MFQTRFNHNPSVGVTSVNPSLTQQQFKEECDINLILARFTRTGVIDSVAAGQAIYGDFSNVQDYQTAQNSLLAAQQAFDSLDSSVRKRFNNNPAELLAFMDNPDNAAEAFELGLINSSPVVNKSESTEGVA